MKFPDDDSGSDDDMQAEYLWDEYVSDKDRGMTFDELKKGWHNHNKTTSVEEMKQAWKFVNLDRSKTLSFEEFRRLFEFGEGPPKELNEKLEWYWRLFAHNPDKGMSWDEYLQGSKIESAKSPKEEIEKYFKMLDKDGNRRLSRDEFFDMTKMVMKKMDGERYAWRGHLSGVSYSTHLALR